MFVENKIIDLALKIRNYCGIDFTTNLNNLELKISKRLMELDLKMDEYSIYLEKNEKEWDKLVEYITVNETFFFREFNQLEEFQNLIKVKKGKQINIWCIPCSTGEEAYSLAILAKEMEPITGNRVRIFASDLNKKVVNCAKKGLYMKNSLSFRRLPQNTEYIKKYFTETDFGYEVKKEIKEMISFEPFNLTNYNAYAKYNQMDFIFCRNVLFYFNEEINKKIIENFYSILKNDGYLFLGHAESIANIENKFKAIHTKDTFYYVKGE